MGVIARQTLKSSTVGYAAAIIGLINTFFIYTLCFDEAGLGRFRYVQEMGIVLASFFSLGITNVIVRFFPEFRDDKSKHHGFLGFIILVLLAGILVFIGLYGLTYSWWPSAFQDNIIYIFLLFVSLLFANSFYYYSSNFRLITIPNVFRQLWVKVGLGLSALAFLYLNISYDQMLSLVVIVYAIATLGVLFYLVHRGNFSLKLDFKYLDKKRIKSIGLFAGFGLLGSLGSSLANKLDVFMVTEMLNFSKTGVYSLALSITGLMVLATGPLLSITGPILADSLAKNDMGHVKELYKKSSVNLFLFGSLLLLLLWVNVDAIFQIIPNGEKYADGKIVILILGIAKLADMVTSVNEVIIAYSKYFRFNLYALLLLGILNIGANLLFIPQFDIAGAALATCLSVILYNAAKTVYIYRKFSMHPFQLSLLFITILGICCYFAVETLVQVGNPYLSMVVKSTLVVVVFIAVSLHYGFSDDATKLWNQVKTKVEAIFSK
jgi:O-antigen/teichoic acid export membrane protein